MYRSGYLYNPYDFSGAQLKFKARTGCLGLEADLEQWKESDGICKLCDSGSKDTMEHYLLYCGYFNKQRISMYNNLETELMSRNYNVLWQEFISGNRVHEINFLLGDHGEFFDNDIGNIFDRIIKLK